jgi:hypothetical protein
MEFAELKINDVRFLRGAAVGMSLDPYGNTFYVLQMISANAEGEDEQTITYAIPPGATDGFLRVISGMDPKRE